MSDSDDSLEAFKPFFLNEEDTDTGDCFPPKKIELFPFFIYIPIAESSEWLLSASNSC